MVFGLTLLELFLLVYGGGLTLLILGTLVIFVGFPRIGDRPLSEDPPRVSVILPVRNQEGSVAACVESLLSLDYPDLEILAVEGGSEDRTREILAQYEPRIRVLEEPPLPDGWVGKNWACWQGYRAAQGDLLLFTDGDTRHGADLLRRAVAYLQQEELDVLTLYPRLRVETFWERAVLPLMIFLIGLTHRGTWVNRPDSKWAIGNGQFLLFRREAYEALGGHAAVRDRVDEDYRLARRTAEAGRRIVMADAREALEVRMYTSLRDVWYGFAKNAFPGLDFSLAKTTRGVAGLFLMMVLPFLLLAAGALEALLGAPSLLLPAGGFLTALVTARTAVAFAYLGTPLRHALVLPVASLVIMGILLDSARRYLRGGGVAWKGRTYGWPQR